MDNKELEERILAVSARGEEIKCHSRQAAISLGDPAVNPAQAQSPPQPMQPRPRPLNNGRAAITWAAIPERESPAR
jgi:hypothetical protein